MKKENGTSYIEVLLAVIILGISSSSLLNAIASGNQVTDKYTDNQINFNFMTTAGEVVSKEEYNPCGATTLPDVNNVKNPYTNVANFLKNINNPVQIWEVMALGSDRQWHACGDTFWSNSNERPSLFQRIKICAPSTYVANSCETLPGNNYWRYIFKNLGKITAGYNVKASSDSNFCSSSNLNSINIVSGYVKNLSLLACNANYTSPASSNLNFYTMPGSGPQALSSSCTISQSNELTIALSGATLSICPGKTYIPDEKSTKKVTIEIGAVDINNSTYYNPISLAVNIYYPPTLVDPGQIITESQLDLFGCETNMQGCTMKRLNYVGGIPEVTVNYALASATPSSASISGASNFTIDAITGELTLLGIVSNTGTIPGAFSTTVALSGGGLPYAVNQTPFNVTINPLINLSLSSSMGCAISSCTANSFNTLASSGLYNLASLTIKSSDASVSPTIVNPIFNAVTAQWTFSISASFACKTYKSGRDTFYLPIRSTFTISDSVAVLTSKYSSNSIAFSACA